MELVANLSISDGVVYQLTNSRPGVIRCDADGLAFLQRGNDDLEQLSLDEMESVAISTHIIGADDVVVTLKQGGVWSLRVSGGEQLIDALRALGVPVRKT